MKQTLATTLLTLALLPPGPAEAQPTEAHPAAAQPGSGDRTEHSRNLCRHLFGSTELPGSDTDPELMSIIRRFADGDIAAAAESRQLDAATRELIACTILVAQQQQSELRRHAEAALRAGASPIRLREAIYQCTPFLGYPRVLSAVETLNEVLRARGIALPLASQGTTTEENRYERGLAIQKPLYGDEIARNLAGVPGGAGQQVARFLTEHAFGDFYTRGGLTVRQRELLLYSLLIAMEADRQLPAHTRGCMKLGISRETLAAVALQCLPYVGFPPVMKALKAIENTEELPPSPEPPAAAAAGESPVPDATAPAAGPQPPAPPSSATPQSSAADAPLVRLSRIEVDPQQLGAYNALLREEIEASMRLEPGVLTLYATAEKEHPHRVTILEIYANAAAYRSHLQTPHFRKYKQGTLKMVQKLELIDSTALIPDLTIKPLTR